MTFSSTAIYSNRAEDKNLLESTLHISERGNSSTIFYVHGVPLFKGYHRVVYGDHGPYIEFSLPHIMCNLIDRVTNRNPNFKITSDPEFYYRWFHPINFPHVKMYYQLRSVKNLTNAPNRPDKKPSKFNRSEGYADYKPGYFYVDPHWLSLSQDDVKGFFGAFRWLSNFFLVDVKFEGDVYPSTESAYQSAKIISRDERKQFQTRYWPNDSMRMGMMARKMGRMLKICDDWEHSKFDVMREVCQNKFFNNEMRELLLLTKNSHLEETNDWGDQYWGVCGGVGDNNLGKILMKIREDMQKCKI